MLTVACVLSKGDDPRRQYEPEHVYRLELQMARFLHHDYEFICLTNMDGYSGHCIDLQDNLPGWWSKIELFRPGLFDDRVLYFDLDVTVVDNLDEVVEQRHPFMALRDFLNMGLNSSVMMWDPPAGENIYTNFTGFRSPGGDQRYITKQMPNAAIFPRQWFCSYKMHVIEGEVPEGAKAVIFHGHPKPWEAEELHA